MKTSQKLISSAVLAPDVPTPENINNAKGNPARRRFSVYRNNVAVSLKEALKAEFAFIYRCLGGKISILLLVNLYEITPQTAH